MIENKFRFVVADKDVRSIALTYVDERGNYDACLGYYRAKKWKTFDGADKAAQRVSKLNPIGGPNLVVQRIAKNSEGKWVRA